MNAYRQMWMTGYSGFLGSNLWNKRLREAADNRASLLIGRSPAPDRSWPQIPMDLSLSVPCRFPSAPRSGRILLVHFAARLPGADEPDFARIERNEKRFLEDCAAQGVTDIVYASTGAVYGYREHSVSEHDSLDPGEGYAAYKRSIESFIMRLWPERCLILRYFFPYGPGQITPRLLPDLIKKIAARQPVSVSGTAAGLLFNPVYLDDATEAAWWLIRNEAKGVFNVAGRQALTFKEMACAVSKRLSVQPLLSFTNDKDRKLVASTGKLLSMNRHLLVSSLEQSLDLTVSAYLHAGLQRRPGGGNE
jgi:nucleoside-diphosphate-sugar epimerase